MAVKLKLKLFSTPYTQRGQGHQVPSSEPADGSRSRAQAGGSKTGAGQRAVLELLPGCQARQLCRGKGNYSSRLRAAKAAQKEDCSATKGNSALQLSPLPTAPPLPHTSYQNSKLLMRSYHHLTFPLFSPVMKRTEQ